MNNKMMAPQDQEIIIEGTNLSFSDDIESSDDSTVSLEVNNDELYSPTSSQSKDDDEVKQLKNTNSFKTSENNSITEVTNSQNSGGAVKTKSNESTQNSEAGSEKNSNLQTDVKLPTIAEDLEAQLTCPLCKSIFHVPVLIVPCNHTFCSECIRNSLRNSRSNTRKSVCPACRVNTDEKNIVPCHNLERIARLYKSGIKDLILEKELKLNPAINSTNKQSNKLQKKAGLVYHGLKRKRLIQILAAENLPTHGTDQELKERHKQYILLYNSECDALYPRTPSEIVQVVMKREKARKNAEKSKSEDSRCLEKLKNGDECNEDFRSKLNTNFKNLIKKVKDGDELKNHIPSCIKQMEEDESENDELRGLNGMKTPFSAAITSANLNITSPSRTRNNLSQSSTQKSMSTSMPFCQKAKEVHQNTTLSFSQKPNDSNNSSSISMKNTTPKSSPSLTKSTSHRPAIAPSPLSSVGPWTCSLCTFYNITRVWTNATCEMCDESRPPPPKRRKIDILEIDLS